MVAVDAGPVAGAEWIVLRPVADALAAGFDSVVFVVEAAGLCSVLLDAAATVGGTFGLAALVGRVALVAGFFIDDAESAFGVIAVAADFGTIGTSAFCSVSNDGGGCESDVGGGVGVVTKSTLATNS